MGNGVNTSEQLLEFKQEGIAVEYQPPACEQAFRLHSEQV